MHVQRGQPVFTNNWFNEQDQSSFIRNTGREFYGLQWAITDIRNVIGVLKALLPDSRQPGNTETPPKV